MSWPAGSTSARATRSPLPTAIALAAVVVALGACGSDGGGDDGGAATAPADQIVDIAGTEPVGEETAGSVASLVECRDWNEANNAQRLATIEDVRSQLNPEDPGQEDAPALTDAEAQELFDGSCRPAWAQGFRLYKLYARAVGFVPLRRALDE